MKNKPLNLPMIRGDRKDNLDYRDNLPVNFTAVVRNVRGDAGYLLTHDGLTQFADTNGKARAGAFNERFNKHYRVSGDNFEEISPKGVVTNIGLTPGDGICSMSNSFNTQAILTDGNLYLWDNATLVKVTDPQLGFPIDITWFKGIYVMTDGEFLFHTDIDNEMSISPFKYTSSEFSSDKILAVACDTHNQIVAFNRYSTEYFYFDPTVNINASVLVNIPQAANKIGILGTYCQTLLDGNFYILGGRMEESPSIHLINAGQELTVATREIDKVIAQYTEDELVNVVLESRTVDRDKLLIIHLPNETIIYNQTVAEAVGPDVAWAYVKTGVQDDEPWRGKFGVFDPRCSKWIYGDILENKLGYLDRQSAAQYGNEVECICYSPLIEGIQTYSIDSFEIDTISGFTPNDLSSAFSISYDGVSYGMEYWNVISKPDRYQSRYKARRLGYVRQDFNYRFRFVSKYKMAFSKLKVEYS